MHGVEATSSLEELIIDAKSKIICAVTEAITVVLNMSICQTGDCFRDCDFDEWVK